MHWIKKKGLFYSVLFLLWQSSVTLASDDQVTLRVSMLVFSVEQRNVFEELATLFSQRHPNIHVQYLSQDDTNYKKHSALWLENPKGIDVLNWAWPRRLEEFVEAGRIEPITDLWQQQILRKHYSQYMKDLVSIGEHQYALPYSRGYWGFFYRASLFDKLSLKPPETWQELLLACRALKDNETTPILIGTQFPWPTGGWFDLLNLRINGASFHGDVADGKIPFTDPRIHKVFVYWQQLVKEGCFNRGANQVDIRQLLPLLYRDNGGMMLSGSFMVTQVPKDIRDDFKFFRFPVIDESVPLAEVTPTDMLLIPASSKNKEAARAFLLFMSEARAQSMMNKAVHYLPVNENADIRDDYFLSAVQNTLDQADDYVQYFDRDAPYDFAKEAFAVFAQFIDKGDIQMAQQRLEEIRQRHF